MGRRSLLWSCFFAFLVFAGCVPLNKDQPFGLSPVTSKLTMTIQMIINMPEGGHPVPDDKLLEEAFKERPELGDYFSGLHILIKHNGRDVVILVCSPDGKHGWVEDASWTPEVDKEWFEIDPSHPAVFTMDPSTGSKGPGG